MFEETKPIKKFIQDVTELSSQEALWETFNEALAGTPFYRWYYMSYLRLSGSEGIKPIAGFENDKAINVQGCDIPNEVRPKIIKTFREITTPCFIEDIPEQVIISNETLTQIRQVVKLKAQETVLFIPCFGASFNKGYFLLIAETTTTRPSIDETVLLSMECQFTHTHYRGIIAAEKKGDVMFSAREKKILELVAEGLSNYEISKTLGLSPHIINIYLRVIFKKTNSPNRTTAALNGIALGLIY